MLIIGLGNPDEKYQTTRHNVGFMVVDALAKRLEIELTEDKYMLAEVGKNNSTILVKPKTYVNNSGQSVEKFVSKNELTPNDVWVIQDDTEIPFGTIRVKVGGTSGGHNGIKSIDEMVGQDYWRIKVGVGRDDNFRELSDYVLAPFTKEEQEQLPIIIDRTVSYLLQSIDEKKLTPITFNATTKNNDNK